MTVNPNWPLTVTTVAFDSDPFDPDQALPSATPVMMDISERVQTNDVATGRQYELDVNQAGSMTMTILDSDEIFNPTNTFSPYYPNVKVYRRIADQALWPNSATTGNLFNPISGFDPTLNSYAQGSTPSWLNGIGGTVPQVSFNEVNLNPYFESGITDWKNNSNCTLLQSTDHAFEGTFSMKVTPTTSPASATPETSARYSVTPGRTYQATARVWATVASTFSVGIKWFDVNGNLVSTTTASLPVTVGEWVPQSVSAIAPRLAITASMVVISTIASNGDIFYVDVAKFGDTTDHNTTWTTVAGATSQGVGIQLPCSVGVQYTASVYVRQSAGSTLQASILGGVTGTSTTSTGTYTRIQVTFTATATVHTLVVATTGTALAGTVELDLIQYETGASANAFRAWGPTVYGNLLNAYSGFFPASSTAGIDPSFEIYRTDDGWAKRLGAPLPYIVESS